VPPRVGYGASCLLIMNAIGSVFYSVGWGLVSLFVSYLVAYFVICLNHMV
jgi:hypothetical protein